MTLNTMSDVSSAAGAQADQGPHPQHNPVCVWLEVYLGCLLQKIGVSSDPETSSHILHGPV